MKFQALVAAGLVAILFCGCDASRPGDAQAHEIVENSFSDIKKSDDIRYQQTYNNLFDRAFTYDHVGRMTNAWTGSRARGFINDLPPDETEIAPYNLKYDYDVWGNQTSQFGNIWSSAINETVSYQNMRHNDWTMDLAVKSFQRSGKKRSTAEQLKLYLGPELVKTA